VTADGAASPTVARRELGQRLRGLRNGRDLSVAEAAQRAGCSQSQLTKIELGQTVAKREDVLALLDVYEETDTGQQAALLAMVKAGARKEWWDAYRALPRRFGTYLSLEQAASTLQAYDTTVVHGLLQTPGYARALLRTTQPELLPHEIDQLVELRTRRQTVLTRTGPPPLTLWSVMDEAVLRRPIGGRETLYGQLQRLIECSALPNVTLLVMPDELGAHPGLDGPFAMLQFGAGAHPVAYTEGQAGHLFLERDDDLRRCRQTMNHILAAAPSPEQSLALIRKAARELAPHSPAEP
jgi:transcriptional regulator with XRE-family HTH domain